MKTKSNYVVKVLTLLLSVFTLVVVSSCGEKQENGHGYVDLGLPSGTMWATCNVGASNPKEYGELLPWEDIQEAQKQWGGKWRIPTKSEIEELFNFCEAEKKIEGNIIGISLKGPNGNSVFIPCSGIIMVGKESASGIGKELHIWSNTENISKGMLAGYGMYEVKTGYCGEMLIHDDGKISKKIEVSDEIWSYSLLKWLNSLRLVFTQEAK